MALCGTKEIQSVIEGVRRPNDDDFADEAALETWIRRNSSYGRSPRLHRPHGPGR